MDKKQSLPSEWSNDEIMDVFFSPFRGSREVNPRAWDSKMKFWTEMIRSYCIEKKVLTVCARNLTQNFERNRKVPVCFNVVFDDLQKRNVIEKLSDYYNRTNTSWFSWSLNLLVKKPVRWSFNNLVKKPLSWAYGLIIEQEDDDNYSPRSRDKILSTMSDEKFVLLELVKPFAEAIYQRHQESVTYQITDNVVRYSLLEEKCRDICSDEQSFHLAILELIRQKLCSITIDQNEDKLIRMVSNKRESAAPLSETEQRIYRLNVSVEKLEDDISKINEEMEQCRNNAKVLLKEDKKSAALRCLKKKKLLEASIAKREQAIDKINDIIRIIQDTESQKQIVEAYASGVKAFKEITRKHGLSEGKIDETMSDIQEAFEANDVISQTISQPIAPSDLSDHELEDELEAIMNQKPEKTPPRTVRKSLPEMVDDADDFSLPDVPQHEPFFISSRAKENVSQ